MDQQPQLIELTPEHAAMLHSLVHPYTELEKKGYIMSQLSKESLDRKKRCGQCSKGKLWPSAYTYHALT